MLFGVPLSVDPLACILGVIAVWLAWAAFRSSTYHIVRVEKLSSSWVNSLNELECGPNLEVTILNCGLPIHSLKVSLFYLSAGANPMRLTLGLTPLEPIMVIAFDKGMRGKFALRPLRQPNTSWFEERIQTLKNPRKQCAAIVIESGSFTVLTIPLVSRLNPMIAVWNRMATSVNRRLSTTKNGYIRTRNCIPVIGLGASWSLIAFARSCKDLKETHNKFQSRNAAAYK